MLWSNTPLKLFLQDYQVKDDAEGVNRIYINIKTSRRHSTVIESANIVN